MLHRERSEATTSAVVTASADVICEWRVSPVNGDFFLVESGSELTTWKGVYFINP